MVAKSTVVQPIPPLTFSYMLRTPPAPSKLHEEAGRFIRRGMEESQAYALKTIMWPGTSHFASLGLRFFIYRMKGWDLGS